MAFFDGLKGTPGALNLPTSAGYPAGRHFAAVGPDVGGGSTYRMRGFDQNGAVNDYVFWDATEVDGDASEYTGSAGPVVDVILHKVIGG